MIAEAPTTEPTTLVEVAGRLDEITAHITAVRSEMADEERAAMESINRLRRTRQAEIDRLEDGARDLLATQRRLMEAAYPGLFPKPTTPKRNRAKATNGQVPLNVKNREENKRIREYAERHGLECPPKGDNNFSQELRDAWAHSGE
jgi:hypothetical protein